MGNSSTSANAYAQNDKEGKTKMQLKYNFVNNATTEAGDFVVEYGVLSFGYGALGFVELHKSATVLFKRNLYALFGLAVAKLCRAKLHTFGQNAYPVEIFYSASAGVEGAFVPVGNVKNIVF